MSCWESLLYLPTFPYPCQPVLHNCCPHHSQQHQQRFLSSPWGWFFSSSNFYPWRGFSGKRSSSLIFGKWGTLRLPTSSGNCGQVANPATWESASSDRADHRIWQAFFPTLACLPVPWCTLQRLPSQNLSAILGTSRSIFKIRGLDARVTAFYCNFARKTSVTSLRSFWDPDVLENSARCELRWLWSYQPRDIKPGRKGRAKDRS